MRDTDLLRLRLQTALTCCSLALATCGDGDAVAKPLKVSKTEGERSGAGRPAPEPSGDPAGGGPGPTHAATDPAPVEVPVGAPGNPEGAAGLPPVNQGAGTPSEDDEFDYFGVPRDPYADHDEEEGCPKGDWCGSPSDAALFAVQGVEAVMECPARIVANPQAQVKDPKAKRWKGFSFDGRMQGRLVTTTTEESRKQTKIDDLCCYHWFEYCSGRPLLDDDAQVLAALRRGEAWCSAPQTVGGDAPEPLSTEQRAYLAKAWLDDARMEHASIASFARATLELMALAAPPDLLADVQLAAIDEVRHAARCFALARRYAGVGFEPGPLPVVGPREPSLARLAADTFIEGCVGETVAALLATRQSRHCTDAAVSATLAEIADDEARHAALAWRTLEWALRTGDRAVVESVTAVAEASRPGSESNEEGASDPGLPTHGRLGTRACARARRDAWREIIDPTLARLLAAATDRAELTL